MRTVADCAAAELTCYATTLGLTLVIGPDDAPIPGSFWGAPEAGLIAARLYVQPATPLHSLLHEAAHFVVAPSARRARLHTDAGGDDAEEESVCALQVLLAASLPNYSVAACLADMDAWGYSFRQGSAAGWFAADAPAALARLAPALPA